MNEYRAYINVSETPMSTVTLNKSISASNVSQQVYSLSFTFEICQNLLINTYVNAVAITNGSKGVNTTKSVTDSLNNVTLTSQMFTSTGIENTLSFEVNPFLQASIPDVALC